MLFWHISSLIFFSDIILFLQVRHFSGQTNLLDAGNLTRLQKLKMKLLWKPFLLLSVMECLTGTCSVLLLGNLCCVYVNLAIKDKL